MFNPTLHCFGGGANIITMDKKTQDLSWACLPKEARDRIKTAYKSDYVSDRGYQPTRGMEVLQDVFGFDNLTSDTEPEEMLMAKASEVKALYKNSQLFKEYKETEPTGELIESWLINLFGDKCIPDKPSVQGEPKFRKGDKVIHNHKNREVGEVAAYFPDEKFCYSVRFGKEYHNMAEHQLEPYTEPEAKEDAPRPHKYSVGQKVLNHYCKSEILTIGELAGHSDKNNPMYRVLGYPYLWNECELDPYTEPETKDNMLTEFTEDPDIAQKIPYDEAIQKDTKDNMEEKELNLCELLKGCEGEEFYLLDCGNVILDGVQINNARGDSITFLSFHSTNFDSGTIIINPNGKRKVYGSVILYPSRALYEKYPIDAKKAWQVWSEERKPKRWRAEEGKEYWYLSAFVIPETTSDDLLISDNKLHECGNYFRTKEEAEQAAEAVRECLEKFHKDQQ